MTTDRVLDALSSWRPFRAVVIGDAMLDQMVFGEATRLTNDAPAPVLRVMRQEDAPGGAANVCLDLRAMRAEVEVLGVVGDDAPGASLVEAFGAEGIDASGLVVDASRPTTVKRSYIGLAQARHPQKMFRVDSERTDPVGAEIEDELLRAFDRSLGRGADVVIIEDYNKGVCTPRVCRGVIERAAKAGVEVLVDPAPIESYAKYAGATAITPNRTEGQRATGGAAIQTEREPSPAEHAELARRLRSELDLDAIVLTLDRDGAVVVERGSDDAIPVPTVARAVYDVTGAGDMMVAGLAAARAQGLGWSDATELANAAAGLEVEVFGVAPIPIERIHAEILEWRAGKGGALRSAQEASVRAEGVRRSGGRVVFTNGCFDLVHAGHVDLLEKARSLGDLLIVGLNSDASVRRLKGEGRPVNSEADRARVLGALGAVDAVVLFDEDTPIRLIEAIGPDVLVKGGDYTPEQVVGREAVESGGGRIEIIPLVEGKSTTRTIEKMRS